VKEWGVALGKMQSIIRIDWWRSEGNWKGKSGAALESTAARGEGAWRAVYNCK